MNLFNKLFKRKPKEKTEEELLYENGPVDYGQRQITLDDGSTVTYQFPGYPADFPTQQDVNEAWADWKAKKAKEKK